MTYSLEQFNQEDKDWLLSLKRKMAIDQSAIEKLWEIHLKLLGKYPNHNKGNACGRCIVEVLDDAIAKASEIEFSKPEIKPEVKTKKKNGM